ncbi:MAG: hypothetical protein AMXMBFR48_06990 [Ignavibacteriales bacterium]
MLEMQKKFSTAFYAILSLPATAMGFALSVQISALSWILSTKFGLDLHEIGYVWAAGPLAGIFGQVIVGLISDKVWFWGGRRRPFIFIGGPIAALMLLALPNIGEIADAVGLTNLIVVATAVALTLDLAINISFNPTRSIIADVTPEGDNRTKGYTWMQTISGFFGVLAYIIGATWGNIVLIYIGVAVVLLFSVLPVLFIKEPKVLTQQEENTSGTSHSEKSSLSELMKLYLAHGFSWIGVQTMFVYTIGFIQQNLSTQSDAETGQVISISFAVLNTVGFILPALVFSKLSSRIGRVKTHYVSLFVMAAAYLYIAFKTRTITEMYIAMAFAGVGWAAIVSLPFAIMSEKVDKNRMGYYMGIFNLSVVIPQLVVSLVIGGFIQAAENKNIIYIVAGVSLLISAVLWMSVRDTSSAITTSPQR